MPVMDGFGLRKTATGQAELTNIRGKYGIAEPSRVLSNSTDCAMPRTSGALLISFTAPGRGAPCRLLITEYDCQGI